MAVQGYSYRVGTLSKMGPGYFPVALGVILTLVGAALGLKGFLASTRPSADALRPEWRAWCLICLSIAAFIVLAQYAGLLPASLAIAFISALADRKNTWKKALVLALAIAFVSVVVFWWALQIQLPLLRWGNG